MNSKKLIFNLTAASFISLTIFFKKIVLSKNALPMKVFIQITIIYFLILSINLFMLQKKDTKEKIKKIKLQNWKNFILAGIFNLSAMLIGTYGLLLTTSINYSFLIKSSLVFIIILAYFFLQEKITKEKTLLMIIFMLGTYLVVTGGKLVIPHIGDLLILLAAFFYSLASIFQKNLLKLFEPEITCWGAAACATFFALILCIVFKINIFSSKAFLLVFLVGLMNSLLILFQSKAMHISSLTYYAMMSMLAPIINVFLGLLFLKETINLIQMIGGIILLLSGLYLQRLKI